MIQSHQAKDEKERGETFILEKKKERFSWKCLCKF